MGVKLNYIPMVTNSLKLSPFTPRAARHEYIDILIDIGCQLLEPIRHLIRFLLSIYCFIFSTFTYFNQN